MFLDQSTVATIMIHIGESKGTFPEVDRLREIVRQQRDIIDMANLRLSAESISRNRECMQKLENEYDALDSRLHFDGGFSETSQDDREAVESLLESYLSKFGGDVESSNIGTLSTHTDRVRNLAAYSGIDPEERITQSLVKRIQKAGYVIQDMVIWYISGDCYRMEYICCNITETLEMLRERGYDDQMIGQIQVEKWYESDEKTTISFSEALQDNVLDSILEIMRQYYIRNIVDFEKPNPDAMTLSGFQNMSNCLMTCASIAGRDRETESKFYGTFGSLRHCQGYFDAKGRKIANQDLTPV